MTKGQWDPSLILVMGGGFAVMALAHLVRRIGMKNLCLMSLSSARYERYFAQFAVGQCVVWLGLGACGLLPWTGDR